MLGSVLGGHWPWSISHQGYTVSCRVSAVLQVYHCKNSQLLSLRCNLIVSCCSWGSQCWILLVSTCDSGCLWKDRRNIRKGSLWFSESDIKKTVGRHNTMHTNTHVTHTYSAFSQLFTNLKKLLKFHGCHYKPQSVTQLVWHVFFYAWFHQQYQAKLLCPHFLFETVTDSVTAWQISLSEG